MYKKSSRTAPLIFTSIQDKHKKYLFSNWIHHSSSISHEAFLLLHIQINNEDYVLYNCKIEKKKPAFIHSYITLSTPLKILFRYDAWQKKESKQAFGVGRQDCLCRDLSMHFIAFLLSSGFIWYTSSCSSNDWNNITTARTKPSAVSATTIITVIFDRAYAIAAPAAAHPSTL